MQAYEQFRENVRPVLTVKCEEFTLFGYDKVSEDELWNYLQKKKWKKETSHDKLLYQVVSDIMSIKIGEYMNYATVEAFKSPDWFSEEGREELEKLL